MIKYAKSVDLDQMVLNNISIEESLYYFFKAQEIPYDKLNMMGVQWHDTKECTFRLM